MESTEDTAGGRLAGRRGAQGPTGYRWLAAHATELPLSPAVLNSGLAGLVALVAALAWYALVHMQGRLLPQ